MVLCPQEVRASYSGFTYKCGSSKEAEAYKQNQVPLPMAETRGPLASSLGP